MQAIFATFSIVFMLSRPSFIVQQARLLKMILSLTFSTETCSRYFCSPGALFLKEFVLKLCFERWTGLTIAAVLASFFADFFILPLSSSSFCTFFAFDDSDFLCMLADLLEFEELPLGLPDAERAHRWLALLAVTACFHRSVCPASQPTAHTCFTPCTTDTASNLNSLVLQV
jgi:hypothetical protein